MRRPERDDERGDRIEPASGEPGDRIATLLRLAGPRPEVPPERAARVREAVRAHWRGRTDGQKWRLVRWWPAAAAAIVVLVAAVAVTVNLRPGSSAPIARVEIVSGEASLLHGERPPVQRAHLLAPGDVLAPGAVVVTEHGGGLALRLSTGHSLRVGAATRVALQGGAKAGLDRGSVYVDSGGSASASGRSLTIETPFGDVTESGTQYAVTVSPESMRVGVREGTVAIRGSAGARLELGAGEEALVDREGVLERARIPLHGPRWAWAEALVPPFELEGRSLGEFLDWSAREGGWSLVFARDLDDADVRGIRLGGSTEGLSLDEAIEAVLATCGLEHRVENGDLIVAPASHDADRPDR